MSRQSTVSQTIRAAAEFCLAGHLADGPLSADEVARRTRSAPCTTFRLLRAAATLDKDRPRKSMATTGACQTAAVRRLELAGEEADANARLQP
jgi:hypothetical protein